MVSNIRIYHFCRITCITLMILLRCAWGIKWCLTCINSTSNVIRFLSVVLTNYFRSSWPLVSCKHKIQHLCCLKQINTDLFILSFLTEKKKNSQWRLYSCSEKNGVRLFLKDLIKIYLIVIKCTAEHLYL